eukprot:767983-Hanusia_phi.AAC.6
MPYLGPSIPLGPRSGGPHKAMDTPSAMFWTDQVFTISACFVPVAEGALETGVGTGFPGDWRGWGGSSIKVGVVSKRFSGVVEGTWIQ